MKREICHWIAIGPFSPAMTAAALDHLSGSSRMAEVFGHRGYPDYIQTLFGAAKLLGVLALLAPRVSPPGSEWAYAGFGIALITAAASHYARGDQLGNVIAPLIALGLLILVRSLWSNPLKVRCNSMSVFALRGVGPLSKAHTRVTPGTGNTEPIVN
jgi:hypothetical protein